ncbi:flagellar protein FliS [mine drainage metagenome]|uniref:Flagellar protein FliS n=1 Tax=mine drainage metagenome TaxID=410659 RepID=A0A1J5RMI8_9ZZZZ
MFGLNQRGVNGYAKVSMETGVLAASPVKLIIMLYDGAITACHSAIKHMEHQDILSKGAMLSKAIMIIESGLRLSLDKRAGGEIAVSLDALYAYMSKQLTLANIQNKPDTVTEVIKLLTELKGAWEAIDKIQITTQAQPAPASPAQSLSGAANAVVNRNIASFAKV